MLPPMNRHRRALVLVCYIASLLAYQPYAAAAAASFYSPTGSALDFVMADPAYSILGAAIMNRDIVSPEVFAFLQSPLKGM